MSEEDGYIFIPGTDIGGPVYDGAPCIVCHQPVAPGEGAQAMPPLPALHTRCLPIAFNEVQYGHLEHRSCTAATPMPHEDKHRYRWSHPDAVEVRSFFNLVIYECPHCKLAFHAPQRDVPKH